MIVQPFPFERLETVREPRLGNAVARQLAIAPHGRQVEQLVGGVASARVGGGVLDDPFAASCELRVRGHAIEVRGASGFVRAFAQRLLGGPEELRAPRPLTEVEHAMWALLVAAAVEDLGISGEVWPHLEQRTRVTTAAAFPGKAGFAFVLDATLAGAPCTVELVVPRSLELTNLTTPQRWTERCVLDLPVVVGRCELARADIGRLALRSVITLDRALGEAELVVLGGAVGLASVTDPLVARVATEYVSRAMALPDEARVELTVGLGTTKLSLRQIVGLAVGEVVSLGRPLAGPFDVRAEGKLIGQGELVDVDGELGVRIVSFAEEK